MPVVLRVACSSKLAIALRENKQERLLFKTDGLKCNISILVK